MTLSLLFYVLETEVLNFNEVQGYKGNPVFSSRSLVVLHFIFRFAIHLEPIFMY